MNNFSPYSLVVFAVILSSLPVFLWGGIFLYKSEEKRHMIIKTFMLGALSVLPLVIYREFWDIYPTINLVEQLKPLADNRIRIGELGLNILLLYASVGIIEEYVKSLVVKSVDKNEVNAIKDAIEFSIMVALGFSFAENTFYFIQIYQNFSPEMLFQVFIFRTIFSTFAHVLFSAVYGYHFGIAIFAKKVYKNKHQKSLLYALIYKLASVFNLGKKINFETKHKFLGLFLAASLHAVYNLLLEAKITAFLLPFLIIGVIHVSYLIYAQQNHIIYNPEK